MLWYDHYINMDNETTVIEMAQTSIKIQMSTRDRLVEIGKKNESYDTLINKLIDNYIGHKESI